MSKYNKNEYTISDISHLISKTVLKYINEDMDEKKYTIKDITEIFDDANVMDFYFVSDYRRDGKILNSQYNVDSIRFYKIIEELSKHREEFALKEYCSFITSMGFPEDIIKLPVDVYKHSRDCEKYLNHYIFLIEQVIEQGEEKFINFVQFIAEIYRKYDRRNLPDYDKWESIVMDKNNKFETPASLLLPIIVKNYSEEKQSNDIFMN